MPSTKLCGNPGPANEVIGGVPEIHYFDFYSRGRGQVIRLMWEDAGIAYKDTRYASGEFQSLKYNQVSDMNPLGSLPIVVLNGQNLTQSYAILRHFARRLGEYEGETEEEKYWADVICDAVIDWRTKFVRAWFSEDREKVYYGDHCNNPRDRPGYLKGINQQLQRNPASAGGPYILGQKISYADFVLYQICHDEKLTQNGQAGLKEYPRLAQLADAMESRPNIKSFLASDRYLG